MPLSRFRAALALALLAAAPAAGRTPPAPQTHPALWVVKDADTTIWLFGTIHALPTHYAWRGPVLDAAFGQAKELIIEAKLDSPPAEAAALFTRLATDNAKGLPPLLQRVRAKDRPALAKMIARSGWPKAALDGMESWAAAFILFGVSIGDLGITGADGVEEQLKALFSADHRPIAAFETGEQQLGYFDTLSEPAQRQFLASVADKPENEKKEFDRMLAAWSRGDERAIAASFDTDLKASPELRDVLLAKRNARWADAIRNRLSQPGAVLVAVGAGHLAGPQSVVKMLEAKGLKVERVE